MGWGNADKETHCKVYRYGAHFPVRVSDHIDEGTAEMWEEQKDLFESQMVLANEFYNKLVDIEVQNRAGYREIISDSREVVDAQARLDAAVDEFEDADRAYKEARSKTRKRRPDKKLSNAVKKARKKRITADERAKKARAKAKKSQKKKIEAHNEKYDALKAEERNVAVEGGLWWGTANATKEALPRPKKKKKKKKKSSPGKSPSTKPPMINKRAIRGNSQVATQIQKNSNPELYYKIVNQEDWKSTRPGKILHIRIGSEGKRGKTPIWAKIPFLYDRPLPDEGTIKWVLVVRKRVGVKYHWSVNFVVELPGKHAKVEIKERASCKGNVIAFDLGWRLTKRGLRIAYATDSRGKSYEILLPLWLVAGWDRVQSLRSTRDTMFDEIRGKVCKWKRGRELPAWMIKMLKFAPSWKKQKRLVRVFNKWRDKRFDGDAKMFSAVKAWVKKDTHLYEWERYQERRCIHQRREIFRHWAKYLAEGWDVCVFEDIDFSEMYRKPDIESNDDGVIGLHRRASPGLFRSIVEQAFIDAGKRAVRVEHKGSSKMCAKCWEPAINLDKGAVEASCEACGVEVDRDCNASRVILARGGVVTKKPGVLAKVKTSWYKRLMRKPRRVKEGEERLLEKRSKAGLEDGEFATV